MAYEYRATACDPSTGDVYDSTAPFDTEDEAAWAADDYGLIERNSDMPGLVVRIEKRTKAGAWVDGQVE